MQAPISDPKVKLTCLQPGTLKTDLLAQAHHELVPLHHGAVHQLRAALGGEQNREGLDPEPGCLNLGTIYYDEGDQPQRDEGMEVTWQVQEWIMVLSEG